jgi:hypothetical protein
MNKRIQELARQAYIEDAKSEDPNYQPADVTDDLLEDLSGVFERFAQLIVQECCEVINAAKPGVNQVPAEVALDMTAKNVKAYFVLKYILESNNERTDPQTIIQG